MFTGLCGDGAPKKENSQFFWGESRSPIDVTLQRMRRLSGALKYEQMFARQK